jgi:hypothetical protein
MTTAIAIKILDAKVESTSAVLSMTFKVSKSKLVSAYIFALS